MCNIAGIDIASRKFDYQIIDGNGASLSKGSCEMTRDGFTSFLSNVPEDTIFVMESTGRYHKNICHFLRSKDLEVCVENPMMIKNYVKSTTLRKTKTDSADALSIARYGLANYDRLHREKRAMDDEVISIARRRQEVAEDKARAKTQLKSDLSLAWPEILSVDVFTASMLSFLSSFASPDEVLSADNAELMDALIQDKGRYLSISVEDIKGYAIGSIGVPGYADLVKDSAQKIIFLENREKALTKALIDHEKKVHAKELEILQSIPGVGEITAAHFMADVEDISRFATYQKLIAYMGTDPSIYQSGESLSRGHITKHGNRSLRKYAYIMAQRAIIYSTFFRSYYDKKRNEGFSHRKTMVAVMNKLTKIIFTLLTRGEMHKEES
ncbi:MAG: IS110 family transposase [Spirochaetes bacterium]|uniref:IS110 family transposase n=1 Tax=Candidatus Ornithospirochaeta stercoripullorum TaxID=2840899 RepID=A0A9D9E1A0_9SPIO|nr:IS110 family transposase [Candidatus Ornithospirochaeta stercoripullorum]